MHVYRGRRSFLVWSPETEGFCHIHALQAGWGLRQSESRQLCSPHPHWKNEKGNAESHSSCQRGCGDHLTWWRTEEGSKCTFSTSYFFYIFLILSAEDSNSLVAQISGMFHKECRLETFSPKVLALNPWIIFSLTGTIQNLFIALVKNLARTFVPVIYT